MNLREAAEMALEALENLNNSIVLSNGEEDVIKALRQALAQPEQVVNVEEYRRLQELVTSQGIRLMEYESQPDDEWKQDKEKILAVIRQKGLTLLKTPSGYDLVQLGKVTAQALTQPEQEPVVFYRCNGCGHAYEEYAPSSCDCGEGLWFEQINYYTAPPKREWVGLTDEEIEEHFFNNVNTGSLLSFGAGAAYAEAKLKEKNG